MPQGVVQEGQEHLPQSGGVGLDEKGRAAAILDLEHDLARRGQATELPGQVGEQRRQRHRLASQLQLDAVQAR